MIYQVQASRRDGSKRTFEADTQAGAWEQAADWIKHGEDTAAAVEKAFMDLAADLAEFQRSRVLAR